MPRPITAVVLLLSIAGFLAACSVSSPLSNATTAGKAQIAKTPAVKAPEAAPLVVIHAHKIAILFPDDDDLKAQGLTKDSWYRRVAGNQLQRKWAPYQGLKNGVFHLHLPVLVVNLSPFEKAVGATVYSSTLKDANANAFQAVRGILRDSANGKDPFHPEGMSKELYDSVVGFLRKAEADGLKLLTIDESIPEPIYSRITKGNWEEMGPVEKIRSDGVKEKDDFVPEPERLGSLVGK